MNSSDVPLSAPPLPLYIPPLIPPLVRGARGGITPLLQVPPTSVGNRTKPSPPAFFISLWLPLRASNKNGLGETPKQAHRRDARPFAFAQGDAWLMGRMPVLRMDFSNSLWVG